MAGTKADIHGSQPVLQDHSLQRIAKLAVAVTSAQTAFIYSGGSGIMAAGPGSVALSESLYPLYEALCMAEDVVETADLPGSNTLSQYQPLLDRAGIAFMAAWPIIEPQSGFSGILCLADSRPITLSVAQKESLLLLSQQAVEYIAGRGRSSKPGIKRLLEKKFASLSYYYNAFLNGTDYAVILSDNKGLIKVFNSGAERMLGYSAPEIIDARSIFIFHEPGELARRFGTSGPGVLPSFEQYVRIPANGLTSKEDWTFIRGDGQKIKVQLSVSAIRNEQKEVISYLAIAEDITQKKKIQEELQVSEERHRLFFENSQGLMCSHDGEGRLLSLNTAGAAILGYLPQELIGVSLKDLVPRALAPQLENYFSAITRNGFATGLIRLRHKDGSTKVLYYKNIKIGVGDTGYVIGNAIDVSARIELENDLKRAKVFAERTSMAKDQFLANMSHEIRTPMNAIIGFTDVLTETALSDEQKECVDAIKSAGESLLGIINDILDFSKIQSGKLALEKLPFNPADTVLNACNILRVKAVEKGIQLNAIIGPSLPRLVLGDRLRVSQVLLNLIGNAIKFTEKGEVTVSASLVSKQDSGSVILFSVRDTGIGIPADKIESIFDRFTQASSETTRKYGGTGLGLSISRTLVEMQNGVLKLDSKPGFGSEFSFELRFDAVEADTLRSADLHEGKTDAVSGIRVLLVEDNELNQKLAKKVVSGFGFQIEVAGNGIEGIEKLKCEPFDVVLMDLQMPVMDGYQATIRIRQELKLQVPIIAMTAHSLVGEKEKCLSIGMNDYLSKPFKAADLHFKITGLTTKNRQLENGAPEFSDALVSLKKLKELSAGDLDFEREMLEIFLRNTPKDINSINEAMAARNGPAVKQLSHKLKSGVLVFDLYETGKALGTLETEALAWESMEALWQSARRTLNVALKELEVILVKNYTPGHEEIN